MNRSTSSSPYELVRLSNGIASIRCPDYGETFHPGAGPAEEARSLYVEQIDLAARVSVPDREFVLWDVGTGAAANVMGALQATCDRPGALRIVSFDQTLGALQFAVRHAEELGYFGTFTEPARAIADGSPTVSFRTDGGLAVNWIMHLDDFPTLMQHARFPAPDAIVYDPFSPARNPEMWTLSLFKSLRAHLDPGRDCTLATYSRSTFVRAALLLAGFHVGFGAAVTGKEETTLAATNPSMVGHLLDAAWLDRARRSHSAEPLTHATYRQAPLMEATWEQLRDHPQFR